MRAAIETVFRALRTRCSRKHAKDQPVRAPDVRVDVEEDPNGRARSFLKFYCESDRPLNYAVLVSGPWGSGKTFFVKDFLERFERRALFVSLYGLHSTAQIDDELFGQLHPLMASKAAKLTAQIFRGWLKGALKIHLGKDEEISVNPTIPNVDMQSFFGKPSDRLLVFDDFERSAIPADLAIGYINAFVEQSNCKAIIIANEDELDGREGEYRRVKEKLIGQTLRIVPSVRGALPHLLSQIRDEWSRNFIFRNSETAKNVFLDSGTHNLRVLKYALWDFERISACFRSEDKIHEAELVEILAFVMAIAIDVRVGRIGGDDISQLDNPFGLYLERTSTKINEPIMAFRDRYKLVNIHQQYIPASVVFKMIDTGSVSEGEIRGSLDRSAPFVAEDLEPSWRKAWYGIHRSDEEYERAIEQVYQQLDLRKFTVPGEILHVFQILMFAVRVGAIKKTSNKIYEEMISYVDGLYVSGELQGYDDVRGDGIPRHGYGGLGFGDWNPELFSQFVDHFRSVLKRAAADSLPGKARELLSGMRVNAREFCREIIIVNDGGSTYWDVPILGYIEPSEFVDAFLELGGDEQATVLSALEERYSSPNQIEKLNSEWSWRSEVGGQLKARLSKLRPMSRYRINSSLLRVFGVNPEDSSSGERTDVATPAIERP